MKKHLRRWTAHGRQGPPQDHRLAGTRVDGGGVREHAANIGRVTRRGHDLRDPQVPPRRPTPQRPRPGHRTKNYRTGQACPGNHLRLRWSDPRAEKAGTRASRGQRRSAESVQLATARAKLCEEPPVEDAARLEQLVQTLERRCVDPTDEAVEGVRTRFEALGWNVQVALHDGEELVAELARSGQCDAGYTDDSDVLVWRCPVTYIRTGAARRMTRVRLDLALEGMRFTHAQS